MAEPNLSYANAAAVEAALKRSEWLLPVSLDGPPSLYVGQSAQWQITDYDAFSEYLIQCDAGVASLDGDTIDYTAPASAGDVTLTITVNGVVRAISIEVLPASIAPPALTAPEDGATSITETPTLATSAFAVFGGSDTHIASRYRIWSADGQTLIYDSGAVTDLTAHVVTAGHLQEGETSYLVEVAHQGQSLGWSEYGARITITTALAFFDPYDPANIGTPREGGFFVGVMTYADGDYELIIAPKSSEASLVYNASNTANSGTTSYHDGLANSNAMNSSTWPAAYHCLTGSWGGKDDWHLPARDEFEMCYRNLKPTTAANITGSRPESGQYGGNANSNPAGSAYTTSVPGRTSVALFQDGGSEALDGTGAWYWTSTQYAPDTSYAWIQRCSDGRQYNGSKASSALVRPVRRLKIQ